eukprot:501415-Pyramimonas_sp.AAC.1
MATVDQIGWGKGGGGGLPSNIQRTRSTSRSGTARAMQSDHQSGQAECQCSTTMHGCAMCLRGVCMLC